MQPEKRKYTRTDIVLIVHFRLMNNSYEYALGISRNYSDDGFSLKSYSFDYKPGQLLECTIRHPEGNASVSIPGEIVWTKKGRCNADIGIKFLQMDENKLKAIRKLAGAKEKKSVPVLSADSTFSTEHENHIQYMMGNSTSSNKSENCELSIERKTNTPFRGMPSTKRRQSYFLFIVFLVLSTVIIFSVAARDGKDVFPWVNLSEQKADLMPGQNNMVVAAASDDIPSIIGNDREIIATVKTLTKVLPKEAVHTKDIIRDEIIFDINSTDISSKFYSLIEKVADILLSNPGLIVKLEGHTDNAGSEIYNMELSLRRVAAVRSKLISKGINSSSIRIVCFGQSSPAASNNVKSGRTKNRRVEISIPLSQS